MPPKATLSLTLKVESMVDDPWTKKPALLLVCVSVSVMLWCSCQAPAPPPTADKTPPTIDKPEPVMSVIAASVPTTKLSVTVVVALTTVLLKSVKLARLAKVEVVATLRP